MNIETDFPHNVKTNPLQNSCSVNPRLNAPHVLETWKVDDLLSAIQTGKWRHKIEQLRAVVKAGNENEKDRLKHLLVSPIPSGIFTTRRAAKNLAQASNIAVLDYDKLLPDELHTLQKRLPPDLHVAFIFLSPSGTGLKVGIHIPTVKNDAEYKAVWQTVADHYSQYGIVKIDEACKDISRVCFVSYDPDLYRNYDTEPFPFDLTAWQQEQEQAKATRQSTQAAPVRHTTTQAQQALERAFTWKRDTLQHMQQSAVKGKQHEARRKAGTLAGGIVSGFGSDYWTEDEAIEFLLSYDAAEDRNAAKHTIESAIEHGKLSPFTTDDILREFETWKAEHPLRDDEPTCPAHGPTIEMINGLPTLRKYEHSQEGYASLFVDTFGAVLRFNHTTDTFMRYNGKAWEQDTKAITRQDCHRLFQDFAHSAKSVSRFLKRHYKKMYGHAYTKPGERNEQQSAAISAILGGEAQVKRLDSNIHYAEQTQTALRDVRKHLAKHIDTTLRNSQHAPRVAVTQDEFDQNPHLLNMQNGTFNIETGKHTPHDAGQNLSKIMGCSYEKDATCPHFDEGLNLMFSGDEAMIEYVLRLIYLSLPGTSNEKMLPFCYGAEGDNGKSVFMLFLKAFFGDYFGEIPMTALLTGKQVPNAPDENLAGLQGRRFVVAPESNNFRLNGSRVKQLTGGDPITCRVLHGHNMTFLPSHSLWIVGNKKPMVDADDPAIWLRLKLIEFSVIPKEKQRPPADVLEEYTHEMAGIFNRILAAGARAKKERLTSQDCPEKVTKATNEYREDADLLADFINSHCETGPGLQEEAAKVSKACKTWAFENEYSYRRNAFYEDMVKRGFPKIAGTGNKHYFQGIRLIPEQTTQTEAFHHDRHKNELLNEGWDPEKVFSR